MPAVVQLMSEHWPEPADEELVRRSWTAPKVQLDRDARLEDSSYAIVEDLGDDRVWIDLRGDPSRTMLDWAERRACEIGSRLFAGAWSSHGSLLGALEGRGFGLVRHSYRMQIDLIAPTPSPVWPEGVEVRVFRPGDERVFHAVQEETFEDMWEPVSVSYDEWAHWYLGTARFVPDLWFLALVRDEPAGFAICHPHPGNAELGWVGELGVRRPWRRQGLGRALLLHAFSAFRERGLPRAGLGVDAESLTGANRLYEQSGMHVRARFDIYEKAAS